MKNKMFAIVAGLLFFGFASPAQKIKYRDVFALLEKKQYATAEPLLKKYLEAETENPNAFLFMGIIMMEKHSKMQASDPQAIQVRDLALTYLDKARQGMTRKEISKNEQYYAMYKRRNIRTGEVEVNPDDVVTDIETRIKNLRALQ